MTEFKCILEVETGVITTLYSNHYLRGRADSPSNLYLFSPPPQTPLYETNVQVHGFPFKNYKRFNMVSRRRGKRTQERISLTWFHWYIWFPDQKYLGDYTFFLLSWSLLVKGLIKIKQDMARCLTVLGSVKIRDDTFA